MTRRAILLIGLLAIAADVCAQTPAPQEPPKPPDPIASIISGSPCYGRPPQSRARNRDRRQRRPVEVEEEVIVTATRTGGRIDDQPTRVEVLNREEIEEKMLMTPGDIVMMLNEMGGMRVQTTSPSMGAASVRIQGMQGRYTRVLFDGLPLAGQQVGGLGLLQIPPMDLGQVEVIKGVASALYGAGAMGGVINLVARRPQDDPVREFLFNQSTVGTTDGVGFLRRTGCRSTSARRCWSAAIIRRRTTSTTTAGTIWPATRAASFVRACSGTTAGQKRMGDGRLDARRTRDGGVVDGRRRCSCGGRSPRIDRHDAR